MTAPVTWEAAVRSLLAEPGQAALVRDCYYDRPALAAAERYRTSVEWRELEPLLPVPPGRAVDLGAGHGITSYALSRAGWKVTAVEPDPSELVGRGAIARLADEAGLAIDVQAGTGEAIPLVDATVDLVLARQVLHHARDLERLCAEAWRVLRPGGMFVTVRDHVISSAADLPAFLDAHPLHRLYGGENAFTLAQYRGALRAAGFTIERELGSLDSPINYAPHTAETLREEIARRAGRVPGGAALVRGVLGSRTLARPALALLTRIDRRPGRLWSFVCRRPGRAS